MNLAGRGYTTHRVWRGEGKGYIARGQEVRAHTHTLTRQGEWEKYCNNVLCVCHWINKQHTHTHTHNLQPHLILRGKETLWLYGKVAGSAETLNLDTNIWQKMGTEREPCESVQDIHYYTVQRERIRTFSFVVNGRFFCIFFLN